MNAVNVLFDLPSCVIREICLVWLGDACFKTVQCLDSAVCSKQLRPTLLETYQYMDWENFLVLSSDYRMAERMKWTVARQIRPAKLAVSRFPSEPHVMMSFFRCCGSALKALRFTDFKGAMTGLTKVVGKECKLLETLCLERCNLTVPIADILNQTTTIKEVRLQNRTRNYRRRRTLGDTEVKRHLLERIQCSTVTKLALLDWLGTADVDIVVSAFPNVSQIELTDAGAPLLSKFLDSYQSMQCVRLVEVCEVRDDLLSVVKEHGTLRKLEIHGAYYRNLRVNPTVFRILPMRSITITSYVDLREGLRFIAEYSNAGLEVLKLDNWTIDTTADGLTALGEHCPNLRVLHLRVLTEHKTYESVLKGCIKLEEVWFGDCFAASVEQVASCLVANCPNIEAVAFNDNISNGKFANLLRSCPKLRTVGTAQWINRPSAYGYNVQPALMEIEF